MQETIDIMQSQVSSNRASLLRRDRPGGKARAGQESGSPMGSPDLTTGQRFGPSGGPVGDTAREQNVQNSHVQVPTGINLVSQSEEPPGQGFPPMRPDIAVDSGPDGSDGLPNIHDSESVFNPRSIGSSTTQNQGITVRVNESSNAQVHNCPVSGRTTQVHSDPGPDQLHSHAHADPFSDQSTAQAEFDQDSPNHYTAQVYQDPMTDPPRRDTASSGQSLQSAPRGRPIETMITRYYNRDNENNANNDSSLNGHVHSSGPAYDNAVNFDHGDDDDDDDEDENFQQHIKFKKRTKRFFLGGFNTSITEDVISKYVSRRGPVVKWVSIWKSKRDPDNVVIRLNIEDNANAQLLEGSGFWPRGVRCRQWRDRRYRKAALNGNQSSGYRNETVPPVYGRSDIHDYNPERCNILNYIIHE